MAWLVSLLLGCPGPGEGDDSAAGDTDADADTDADTDTDSDTDTSTTEPRPPIPTLLSSTSRLLKLRSACATIAAHAALSVTSYEAASAVPPSARIIATVRSANETSRSTTNTPAPARANKIHAALPLPIPSPADPPPVTIAPLPRKPQTSSSIVISYATSKNLLFL